MTLDNFLTSTVLEIVLSLFITQQIKLYATAFTKYVSYLVDHRVRIVRLLTPGSIPEL